MRSRLCADDLGFDDHIVGTAQHQQMFDIVPPDNHQLTFGIQDEGVNYAKPWLAATGRTWQATTPAKQQPVEEYKNKRSDTRGNGKACVEERLVLPE
jgi:hypothetical protein